MSLGMGMTGGGSGGGGGGAGGVAAFCDVFVVLGLGTCNKSVFFFWLYNLPAQKRPSVIEANCNVHSHWGWDIWKIQTPMGPLFPSDEWSVLSGQSLPF